MGNNLIFIGALTILIPLLACTMAYRYTQNKKVFWGMTASVINIALVIIGIVINR